MIEAGRLRHTVTIERQVSATNSYNETKDEWRRLFCTRASVEPLQGREFFAASGEHSEVTTRIRCRYSSNFESVDPGDRVNHDGRVYDILSVINNKEQNREMVLMAKRGGFREC